MLDTEVAEHGLEERLRRDLPDYTKYETAHGPVITYVPARSTNDSYDHHKVDFQRSKREPGNERWSVQRLERYVAGRGMPLTRTDANFDYARYTVEKAQRQQAHQNGRQ